jgi:hypothetical protein
MAYKIRRITMALMEGHGLRKKKEKKKNVGHSDQHK